MCPITKLPSPIVVGVPNVLIGGLPAATMTSSIPCITPDTIVRGSANVLINSLPAARMGDNSAHGGIIMLGCPNVMIGG